MGRVSPINLRALRPATAGNEAACCVQCSKGNFVSCTKVVTQSNEDIIL